jgi:hypothetical protein
MFCHCGRLDRVNTLEDGSVSEIEKLKAIGNELFHGRINFDSAEAMAEAAWEILKDAPTEALERGLRNVHPDDTPLVMAVSHMEDCTGLKIRANLRGRMETECKRRHEAEMARRKAVLDARPPERDFSHDRNWRMFYD